MSTSTVVLFRSIVCKHIVVLLGEPRLPAGFRTLRKKSPIRFSLIARATSARVQAGGKNFTGLSPTLDGSTG